MKHPTNYGLDSQGDGYSNRHRHRHRDIDPGCSPQAKQTAFRIMFTSFLIYVGFLFLVVVFVPIAFQEPLLPEVEIGPATNVVVLNVSNNTQLTSNWDIVFRFTNPNKINVSFDQVNALVFDGRDQKPISNATLISPFILLGPKDATDVHATFKDVTMDVDGWIGYDGTGHGTTGMTTLNAKVTIASYGGRNNWLSSGEVTCDNMKVLFSSNSNMTMIAGSNECTGYDGKPLGPLIFLVKILIYGLFVSIFLGIGIAM